MKAVGCSSQRTFFSKSYILNPVPYILSIAIVLAFTTCGGKDAEGLTITNIAGEHKGRYIAGQHVEGAYTFAIASPASEYLPGAKVGGKKIVLNVYSGDGIGTDAVFSGDDEILAGRLLIIMMDVENVHDADTTSNVRGFVNTKLITLKNGSAKINFVTDMKPIL